MAKTAIIYARVEPELKEKAEKILADLGISMSCAINMFLRQVVLQGGIPFEMTRENAKLDFYASMKEEIDAERQQGLTDN